MAALLAFVLLASGWGSAPGSHALSGPGLSVTLPRGWHGLAGPGQLQVADFPLSRRVLISPELARVGRSHVHLIVWDYGPSVPYLAGTFVQARPPLVLQRRDLSSGPLEGFPAGDAYAVRTVAVGGEMLELVADLGPRPLAPDSFRRLNRVLATLRVRPPRVVRARNGRLDADGVALRLPAGWSGRIEIPADQHGAQLVLRARSGRIRLVLLQIPGVAGAHAELPVALTRKNVIRHRGLRVARRVFSTAGRSFDLSVTIPSPAALTEANRLLRTLTAVPRPWTLRSCNLSLRVPGTWRAAVRPRSGCYPIITLHGPGVRLILTELRATEPAHGRVLVRSGRRFEITITPSSATPGADAVLARLRAQRR